MRLLPCFSFLVLGSLLTAQEATILERFQKYDLNGDGRISGEEMRAAPLLPQLDLNQDGELTFGEALRALVQLRRSKRGLPQVSTPPADEDPGLKEAPAVLKAAELGVGRQVPDTPLNSPGDKRLSTYLKGSQGVIIAMFGTACPISNKFGPELARLEMEAAEQQVKLLLVCPVPGENDADIQAFRTRHGLSSPALRAPQLVAALRPTTTTEVFLIDATRTLIYRGAINDQYGLGYSRPQPLRPYLRDALAAMQRHEAPVIAATSAPGCALDTPEVAETRSPLTYHRDIARILQAHCIECHRKDGIAPFSLETYEDVTRHAAMIRKQVERGAMPPWFAEPPAESQHALWLNDRSLAARDKADLLTWLASDRAAGDPADAPQPRQYAEGWTLGEPDAVIQLPRPIAVKAEGTMPYQFVTVETDFPEDRWVQSYEIVPTDRSVVHHVIVQAHPKGTQARDRGEGLEGYWAAYVPGNASHLWPSGFAKKLPAGTVLSFQIHYTPNGKATQDQLKMGLRFASQAPRYIVHTAAVAQPRLNIPPGAAHHVETKEQTVPADMNLLASLAHMHVRGKAFKVEFTPPGGSPQTLLNLPRYDFNWQLRYDYARPQFLPRGSTITITAVFDNSPNNPANPDPTRRVRWGQQTEDEMMIGYFEYYTANPDVAAAP